MLVASRLQTIMLDFRTFSGGSISWNSLNQRIPIKSAYDEIRRSTDALKLPEKTVIVCSTTNSPGDLLRDWAFRSSGYSVIGIPTLNTSFLNIVPAIREIVSGKFALIGPQTKFEPDDNAKALPTRKWMKFDDDRRHYLLFESLSKRPELPSRVFRGRITSGTLSGPKLVCYTASQLRAVHDNLYLELLGDCVEPLVIIGLPICWAAGSFVVPALESGGTILLTQRLSYALLQGLEDNRECVIFATPRVARSLAKSWIKQSSSTATFRAKWVMAGQPLDWRTVDLVLQAFPNSTITNAFGMTEASLPITVQHNVEAINRIDHCDYLVPVGEVTQGYRDSEIVGMLDTKPGELVVRGNAVAETVTSHQHNIRLTGQCHSGDLFLRRQGRLYYFGRLVGLPVDQGDLFPLPAVEASIEAFPSVACVLAERKSSEICSVCVEMLPAYSEMPAAPEALCDRVQSVLNSYGVNTIPKIEFTLGTVCRTAAGKKIRQ